MYISVFLLHNGDPSGQEDTLGLPIHTSFVFHCFLIRPNKYFRNNVYVKLFTAIFFYKFPPLWSSILHKQIELIILKQTEFFCPPSLLAPTNHGLENPFKIFGTNKWFCCVYSTNIFRAVRFSVQLYTQSQELRANYNYCHGR